MFAAFDYRDNSDATVSRPTCFALSSLPYCMKGDRWEMNEMIEAQDN